MMRIKSINLILLTFIIVFLSQLTINPFVYAQKDDTTKKKEPILLKPLPVKPDTSKFIGKSFEEVNREMIQKQIKTYGSRVQEGINTLNNPSADIRSLAIEALWKSRDRRAIQPLIKVLKIDSVAIVRGEAAQALGIISAYVGDKQAVPALREALNDEDEGVAMRAALSLLQLGEKSSLLPFLFDIYQGKEKSEWQVEGYADIGSIVKGEERKQVLNHVKGSIQIAALRAIAEMEVSDSLLVKLENVYKGFERGRVKHETRAILDRINEKKSE